MRDLWQKILGASAARFYSLAVSLVTLAITARLLGPEGRGTVAAVTTWTTLFMTFGYLSLGHVALHHATEKRGTDWLGETLGSLLSLTAILTIAGWTVAFGLYIGTEGAAFKGLSSSILIVGFLSLPLLIWEQYGSSLLTARDRVSVYNRAQVVGRTLGLILLLVLVVNLRLGVMGALLAMIGSQAMVALGGLRVLIREAKAESRVRPTRATTKALLTGGLKLHLNAIGSFLFLYTDVLIVNHYRGNAETGFYQLAVQLLSMLLIPAQAAISILASRMAQQGPDEAWKAQRKVVLSMMCGMGVIGVFAYLLAPFCVGLLGSGKFLPAAGVFRVMLPNIFGMTLSVLLVPQWIGRGLFVQASVCTLLTGTVNLISNLILVPRFGMYGSAWATVGTYVVSLLINLGFIVWIEGRSRSTLLATEIYPSTKPINP